MTINLNNSKLDDRARTSLTDAAKDVDSAIAHDDYDRITELAVFMRSWLEVIDDAVTATSVEIKKIRSENPTDPIAIGMEELQESYQASRPIIEELLEQLSAHLPPVNA
jgi:hypothetical protein